MTIISLIVSFLSLIAIIAANVVPEGRIVGGTLVTPFQFPFMALIVSRDQNFVNGTGAGSIISSRYVLTSAFNTFGKSLIEVCVGSIRYQQGVRMTIPINDVTVHAEYDPINRTNDIALIYTPMLLFSPQIQTIRLPLNADGQDAPPASVSIAGWGILNNDFPDVYANTMHFIEQRIVDNIECAARYGPLGNRKICVSTPGQQSPCKGDEGGPLIAGTNSVYGPVLLGVLTPVPEQCDQGHPVVYTRVTAYLDWIRENCVQRID